MNAKHLMPSTMKCGMNMRKIAFLKRGLRLRLEARSTSLSHSLFVNEKNWQDEIVLIV